MMTTFTLYTTGTLMAFVAIACTALWLAWSIPLWRRRLARSEAAPQVPCAATGGLSGWPARYGNGLISAGIAACSAVAWHGCFCCVLAAWIAASR